MMPIKSKCPCIDCITLPICKNKVIIDYSNYCVDINNIQCVHLIDYIFSTLSHKKRLYKKEYLLTEIFKFTYDDRYYISIGNIKCT